MWSSNRHISAEEREYYNLLHKYNPLIFSLIYKKIQNREDVLDVFQNVIIHIWEYRLKLNPSNIESIIRKTCTQEIAHFYRKTKIEKNNLSLDYVDTSDDDALVAMEKEQYISEIERAIEDLFPPIRRKIFKMNKLDGITQDKIAANFNISKRTVEKHISQSILFLKKRVKNY